MFRVEVICCVIWVLCVAHIPPIRSKYPSIYPTHSKGKKDTHNNNNNKSTGFLMVHDDNHTNNVWDLVKPNLGMVITLCTSFIDSNITITFINTFCINTMICGPSNWLCGENESIEVGVKLHLYRFVLVCSGV